MGGRGREKWKPDFTGHFQFLMLYFIHCLGSLEPRVLGKITGLDSARIHV